MPRDTGKLWGERSGNPIMVNAQLCVSVTQLYTGEEVCTLCLSSNDFLKKQHFLLYPNVINFV